jgi:hypothetical protein
LTSADPVFTDKERGFNDIEIAGFSQDCSKGERICERTPANTDRGLSALGSFRLNDRVITSKNERAIPGLPGDRVLVLSSVFTLAICICRSLIPLSGNEPGSLI